MEQQQKLKGIRQTPAGRWQVFVRVNGVYRSRTFPANTTLPALVAKRERLKAEVKYGVPAEGDDRPAFRTEAASYLQLVTAMPSYADRAYRIQCWVEVFGSRIRSTITAREIRAQLEKWRRTGSHVGGPLSQGSLNLRRTALMAMFTTLDGKSAANIVKDVPVYDETYSQVVRAESMVTCVRLIRRIRPRTKMRAILHALLWTGWPHQLLSELTAADVDWTHGKVRVGRRKKGKGMPAAWVPVVPRALLALRRLDELGAWGGGRTSSLHAGMRRAVRAENRWRTERNQAAGRTVWPLVRETFNPYGLRHSFGTWAAARIKDDRALKELLRTNSIARYTEGALAERLAAARDLLLPTRRRQT